MREWLDLYYPNGDPLEISLYSVKRYLNLGASKPPSLTEFRNEPRKSQEKCGDFCLLRVSCVETQLREQKTKIPTSFLGIAPRNRNSLSDGG
jgi:hypothetical protein